MKQTVYERHSFSTQTQSKHINTMRRALVFRHTDSLLWHPSEKFWTITRTPKREWLSSDKSSSSRNECGWNIGGGHR